MQLYTNQHKHDLQSNFTRLAEVWVFLRRVRLQVLLTWKVPGVSIWWRCETFVDGEGRVSRRWRTHATDSSIAPRKVHNNKLRKFREGLSGTSNKSRVGFRLERITTNFSCCRCSLCICNGCSLPFSKSTSTVETADWSIQISFEFLSGGVECCVICLSPWKVRKDVSATRRKRSKTVWISPLYSTFPL